MTPESLRGQIEQIRREALCAWDEYGRRNRHDHDAQEIVFGVYVLWSHAEIVLGNGPPEALPHELTQIEKLEINCGQPRHARRVRALLDQVQRDREAVYCG